MVASPAVFLSQTLLAGPLCRSPTGPRPDRKSLRRAPPQELAVAPSVGHRHGEPRVARHRPTRPRPHFRLRPARVSGARYRPSLRPAPDRSAPPTCPAEHNPDRLSVTAHPRRPDPDVEGPPGRPRTDRRPAHAACGTAQPARHRRPSSPETPPGRSHTGGDHRPDRSPAGAWLGALRSPATVVREDRSRASPPAARRSGGSSSPRSTSESRCPRRCSPDTCSPRRPSGGGRPRAGATDRDPGRPAGSRASRPPSTVLRWCRGGRSGPPRGGGGRDLQRPDRPGSNVRACPGEAGASRPRAFQRHHSASGSRLAGFPRRRRTKESDPSVPSSHLQATSAGGASISAGSVATVSCASTTSATRPSDEPPRLVLAADTTAGRSRKASPSASSPGFAKSPGTQGSDLASGRT